MYRSSMIMLIEPEIQYPRDCYIALALPHLVSCSKIQTTISVTELMRSAALPACGMPNNQEISHCKKKLTLPLFDSEIVKKMDNDC